MNGTNLVLHIENDGVSYNKTISLTQEQYDAVMAKPGNCVVIASAGAGKTRVLIAKVAKLLLMDKVPAENIVLLTYTTNAAHEMKERLIQYTENEQIVDSINIGTVHSYALKTLEKHYGKMAVLDINESKSIMTQTIELVLNRCKRCLSSEEYYKLAYYLKRYSAQIYDIFKTDVYTSTANVINDIIVSLDLDMEDCYHQLLVKWVGETLTEYERYKKTNMLVDFNDLLELLYYFLLTPEGIKWSANVKHLLVDEFQDINPIQMKIVQLLNTNQNLTVVGDDAQSIYAFRGGKVEYINKLHQWVTNLSHYYLRDNYRSSKNIVNISQELINTSNETTKKDMIVKKECNNVPIKIITFTTSESEIYWVINDIIHYYMNGGSFKDICILCRWNKELHHIEHYLDIFKLNYINMEQNNIWNKPYMSTMISIMKLLLYRKNMHYWKLLFGIVGKQKEFTGVWEQIKWTTDPIEEFMTSQTHFVEIKQLFDILTSDICMSKKIVRILNWYFIQQPVYNERETESIKREVKIIKRAVKQFDNDTIEQFILRLSNMEIKNRMINNPEIDDAMVLSTLHRSKGLEFKQVYMMHCNEDYLKSSTNYIGEIKHWEEERRLLFVGLTRAIDKLVITGTNINSYIYNSFCKLSRHNVDYQNENNTVIQCFHGSDTFSKHIQLYFRHYSYYSLIKLLNSVTVEGYRSICRIPMDMGTVDETTMWAMIEDQYSDIIKVNKWYKCYDKNVVMDGTSSNVLVHIDKHVGYNYRKPSCEVMVTALLYLFYLSKHLVVKNKVIVLNPWLGLRYTITTNATPSYIHYLIRRINLLEPL